jgi:hypothetical protein
MDTRLLMLSIICIIAAVVAGCTTGTPPAVSVTPAPVVSSTPSPVAPTPMTAAGCTGESDCVPAQCCHPTSCINKVAERACNEMCTMSCQGPLDCGAGSCGCVKGTCSVVPAPSPLATTKAVASVRLEATPQRYSPIMSSTPGIALSVNAPGINTATTNFTWTASYGRFLSWNPPDYTISELDAKVTNHGEKLYWSYTEKPASTDKPVTITVTAKDSASGSVLGSSTVTLSWDGSNAVMVQGIT